MSVCVLSVCLDCLSVCLSVSCVVGMHAIIVIIIVNYNVYF